MGTGIFSQVPATGAPLPAWQKGYLDLDHHGNMLDANRHVIGPLIDRAYKSHQGHILVRVLPGGGSYYVIILDDSSSSIRVKAVFGPYESKKK